MRRWGGPTAAQLAERRARADGFDDGGEDWLRRCAEYDAKGAAFYDAVLVDAPYEEYMAEARSLHFEGREPSNLRGFLLPDGRLVWWNEEKATHGEAAKWLCVGPDPERDLEVEMNLANGRAGAMRPWRFYLQARSETRLRLLAEHRTIKPHLGRSGWIWWPRRAA